MKGSYAKRPCREYGRKDNEETRVSICLFVFDVVCYRCLFVYFDVIVVLFFVVFIFYLLVASFVYSMLRFVFVCIFLLMIAITVPKVIQGLDIILPIPENLSIQ